MSNATSYTVGGTVPPSNGLYIERKADQVLLELCREGTFGYVLTPRQMGKSSLMVRCAASLAAESIRTVIIDLTQIGVQLTAESWYLGLITEIENQLGLRTDALQWWAEQKERKTGIIHRLTLFFERVLLKEENRRIVIFVDEIDTTLSLSFTDDFFAAIRYFYNARAHIEAFARLSFVLIGVATPGDLIRDAQRTPFNIGKRVELTDFTLEEAQSLSTGFCGTTEERLDILRRVIHWTGGHPYLTQRLCFAIAARQQNTWSREEIDAVVAEIFFGDHSEYDNNLQFVRDMLTKRASDVMAVLELYKTIRKGRKVEDNEQSLVKSHLKLSGIVQVKHSCLVVSNAIYARVFDRFWIAQHLPINWTRRLQRAAVGLAMTLLLANVPLTVYALWQRSLAIRQAQLATEAASKSDELAKTNETLANQAQLSAKDALQKAKEADKARLEADKERKLAEEKAAEANALRLEREEEGYAKDGNFTAAQKTIADRIDLADHAPAVPGVKESPEHRARFIDYRQKANLHAEPLWELDVKANGAPAFSQDGKLLAVPAADKTVKLYSTETGKLLKTTEPAKRTVEYVRFLFPDGQQLLSADSEGRVARWDLGEPQPKEQPIQIPKPQEDKTQPQAAATAGSKAQPIQIPIPQEDKTQLQTAAKAGALEKPGKDSEHQGTEQRFLAFSPDGRRIALVNREALQIFDLTRHDLLPVTADLPRGTISGLSPDKVAFTSDSLQLAVLSDTSASVIDAQTGSAQRFRYLSDTGATMIAYDSENHLVGLTKRGLRDAILEGDIANTTEVATQPIFCPDGRLMAFADVKGNPHVFDKRERREVLTATDKDLGFREFAFNGSRQLAAVRMDGMVKIWSLSGLDYRALPSNLIAVLPANGELVSASANGTVRRWRGAESSTLEIGPNLEGMSLSPNGRFLVAQASAGRLDLWDMDSKTRILSLPGVRGFRPRFSPDSNTLVYGWNYDGSLRTLSLTGDWRQRYEGFHYQLMDVALSPDESRVVVSRADSNSITISDLSSRTGLLSLENSGSPVLGAVHSPVEKQVASRHLDGSIVIWSLASGKPILPISAHPGPIVSVSYDPSGKYLASAGGHDRLVKVWDVRSGNKLRSLAGHSDRVMSVKFAPNGKLLASSGADGTVRIWDWSDGKELRHFNCDSSPLLSLDWSADGKLLVTGAANGAVHMIDTSTGCKNSSNDSHHNPVNQVAFGSDNETVFSGDEDGILVRWNTLTGQTEKARDSNSAINGLVIGRSTQTVVYGHSSGGYMIKPEKEKWGRGAESGWARGASDPSDFDLLDRPPDSGSPSSKFTPLDVAFGEGHQVLTLENDGDRLQVRNRKTSQIIFQVPGLSSSISHAELSPDGKRLAYTSNNGINLVELSTGGAQPTVLFPDASSPIAFSPDSRLFAYTKSTGNSGSTERRGSRGSLVHIVDLASGAEKAVVPASAPKAIVISSSLSRVAIQESNGYAKLWNLDKVSEYYRGSGQWLQGLLRPVAAEAPASPKSSRISESDIGRDLSAGASDLDAADAGSNFLSKLRKYSRANKSSALDQDPLAKLRARYEKDPGNPALKLQIGLLVQPFQHLLLSFNAHDDSIASLAISPAGDRFVTASQDGTAKLWDMESGSLLHILEHRNEATLPGGAAIFSVEFDVSGKRILTAGRDGSARLWNADSGTLIRAFDTHTSDVVRATFSPDQKQVLTSSLDRTARLFDAKNGSESVFQAHEPLTLAVFGPDGKMFVTAGQMGELRLWQLGERDSTPLVGHSARINAATFSPSGEWLATASDDRTARIWSVTGKREVARLVHSGPVKILQFSSDGKYLLTAGAGNCTQIWQAQTGKLVRTLVGHAGELISAQFDRTTARIVTSAKDGTIGIWDFATGRMIASFSLPHHRGGHKRGPSRGAFDDPLEESAYLVDESAWTLAQLAPDGNNLIAASSSGTVNVWSLTSDRHFIATGDIISKGLAPFNQSPLWKSNPWQSNLCSGVRGVIFSEDGSKIVKACEDATMEIWDAAAGTKLATFKALGRNLEGGDLSPDGKSLVVASEGIAQVWNVEDNDPKHQTPKFTLKHNDRIWSVDYSPDGMFILTSSRDRTVNLWSATTGEIIRTFPGHTENLSIARFSPDGKLVMTVDSEIRLWDLTTGTLLRTVVPHQGVILAARFSKDGTRFISAGTAGPPKVWDTNTGKLVLSPDSAATVYTAFFSPDGKDVIVGDLRGSVEVWNLESRHRRLVLAGNNFLWNLPFSSDGQYIWTTGDNSETFVWDSVSGKLLARFAARDNKDSKSAFSPDGRTFIQVADTGEVTCWPLNFSSLEGELTGHPSAIESLALSPNDQMLASVDALGTGRIWDTRTRELRQGAQVPQQLQSLTWSAQGQLFSVMKEGSGQDWKQQSGEFSAPLPLPPNLQSGRLTAISLAGNGKSLAAATVNGTVSLWDVQSGRFRGGLKVAAKPVAWIGLNRDGSRLAVFDVELKVSIWNTISGGKLFEGTHLAAWRPTLSPNREHLLICLDLFSLTIVDTATGQISHKLTSQSEFKHVAYSQEGNRILAISTIGNAYVWDAASGMLVRSFDSRMEKVEYAALSPDGTKILIGSSTPKTGSDDGSREYHFKLRDLRTGDSITELPNDSRFWTSAFSSDGRKFATVESNGMIQIWDSITGKQIASWDTHSKDLWDIAFVLGDKEFAVCNREKDVLLWDADTGKPTGQFGTDGDTIWELRFNSDKSLMTTFGQSGTVRVWEVATGREIRSVGYESIAALSAAPDGVHLVSTNSDGKMRVWNSAKDQFIVLEDARARPIASAISADGRRFIATGNSGKIGIWDLNTGKRLAALDQSDKKAIAAVGFGPGPDQIYAGTANGIVNFWTLSGSAVKLTATIGKEEEKSIQAVAVDQKLNLAAIAKSETIELWDMQRQELIGRLAPQSAISTLLFSHGSGLLIAGGKDGTIRQWDLNLLNFSPADLQHAMDLSRANANGPKLSRANQRF